MHDIRAIREAPDAFDADLARRGHPPAAQALLQIDTARRGAIHAAEEAKAAQNAASREVGAAKARGDEAEFSRLREELARQKGAIAAAEDEARRLDAELTTLLLELPNRLLSEVPDGADESDNVELRRWGTPRSFDFAPAEHYEIAAARPGLDFEAAARLSGARFVVMRGAVARLHRALAQFMLDLHISRHGLEETWTPVLVRPEMMLGTGQLPKFGEDSYQTREGWWLVPTAEVTLTNLVHEVLIEDAATLPRRLVAHTQCFRSEAGSAGRDTAGMLRQHQFEKVEMVTLCQPGDSAAEHERMTRCAEAVLEALLLPYRTMVLCAGDTGAGAQRTHDIEVWLPGQGRYREISSVSRCGDWQARRMNARFRPAPGEKPQWLHSLNGSGLAVGRTLIAVLENGQEEDGSVTLPSALAPYLGGAGRITAEGMLV
ncbi:MAG: serine--tRNA ligase [Rhodobacteraceae bacterium]|nr:serine--tRNA ligase [Paracoccaceae bacterium]